MKNARMLIIMGMLLMGLGAQASGIIRDVVFDLDWTLFYPVDKAYDRNTVQVEGKFYRLADGAIEAMMELDNSGHRVSLFSGGASSRNLALANFIANKVVQEGNYRFQFYRILSKGHLTTRPGVADSAAFGDRYGKDLRQVNPDLSNVVLVDDMKQFAVAGQERNVYVIEKTYNFFPQYTASANQEFDPPSFCEWLLERKKIILFVKNLRAAEMNAPVGRTLESMQGMHANDRCQ
jgi:hypothetical protein